MAFSSLSHPLSGSVGRMPSLGDFYAFSLLFTKKRGRIREKELSGGRGVSVVIGIDIGGSTTKIVGFSHTKEGRSLLPPFMVSAADPITSMYGAFGRFLSENGLALSVYKFPISIHTSSDNNILSCAPN